MGRDLELKTTLNALSHLLTVSPSPWGLIEQLMNNWGSSIKPKLIYCFFKGYFMVVERETSLSLPPPVPSLARDARCIDSLTDAEFCYISIWITANEAAHRERLWIIFRLGIQLVCGRPGLYHTLYHTLYSTQHFFFFTRWKSESFAAVDLINECTCLGARRLQVRLREWP